MKRVLAVLSGCVAGVLVVFLSEALVGVMYPFPKNVNPTNMEQIKEIMANAPPMSLILILLGYFLASFVGGIVATAIIKLKDKKPALIVGGILTVLGLLNILMIPHPIWFTIFGLVIYFIGAFCGYSLYFKLKKDA